MMKLKRTSTDAHPHGTAQLELTIFLPLFALLLVMIMTVATYGRAKIQATVAARQNAWRDTTKRERKELKLPATAREDFHRIASVLNNEQSPSHGLVHGRGVGHVSTQLPGFRHAVVVESCYLLQDAWDHRTLKFATRKEHQPLTLDKRVTGLLSRPTFVSLGAILSRDTKGTSMVPVSAGSRAVEQEVTRLITETQAEIKGKQAQLADLQAQLDLARLEKPVDKETVRILKVKIKIASGQLENLKKELGKLQKAEKAIKWAPVQIVDSDDGDDDL